MAVAPAVTRRDVDSTVSQPLGDRHAGSLVRFAVDLTKRTAFHWSRQSGLFSVPVLHEAVTEAVRGDAQCLLGDSKSIADESIESLLRLLPTAIGPADPFRVAAVGDAERPVKDAYLFRRVHRYHPGLSAFRALMERKHLAVVD